MVASQFHLQIIEQSKVYKLYEHFKISDNVLPIIKFKRVQRQRVNYYAFSCYFLSFKRMLSNYSDAKIFDL